jgi:hypothetical protein
MAALHAAVATVTVASVAEAVHVAPTGTMATAIYHGTRVMVALCATVATGARACMLRSLRCARTAMLARSAVASYWVIAICATIATGARACMLRSLRCARTAMLARSVVASYRLIALCAAVATGTVASVAEAVHVA